MRRTCALAFLLALAVTSAPADIGLVADVDGNYQNGPDTLQIEPGDTVLVHVWITGAGDSLVGFGITVGDTSGALVWVEEEGESVYTTPSGWSNSRSRPPGTGSAGPPRAARRCCSRSSSPST